MTENRSMLGTNLRVVGVVIGTILVYTLLANSIPQIESEVPEELNLSANVTPEELAAAGERLYAGAGACITCHGTGTRAPNLLTDEAGEGAIGARCGTRVSGQSCKQYLYASLTEPGAHIVQGYENIMPDMRRTMSAAQIWTLVAYLESLGGEITVTAADIPAAESSAPGGGAAPATASLDPREIMTANQCLACHQIGAEGAAIGPSFDGIGSRLNDAAIRRAILQPRADVAAGYEALANIMPETFGAALTAAQLEAVVSYLARLK